MLFVPVTLLCGTLWVKDLFSCRTVNTITLTHICSMPLAFPFTQKPARLCCGSDPTSSASEPQRNCPSSLDLKLSHRGQCGESTHDSHTERTVWMELLSIDNLTLADLHQGNIYLLQDYAQSSIKAGEIKIWLKMTADSISGWTNTISNIVCCWQSE